MPSRSLHTHALRCLVTGEPLEVAGSGGPVLQGQVLSGELHPGLEAPPAEANCSKTPVAYAVIHSDFRFLSFHGD